MLSNSLISPQIIHQMFEWLLHLIDPPSQMLDFLVSHPYFILITLDLHLMIRDGNHVLDFELLELKFFFLLLPFFDFYHDVTGLFWEFVDLIKLRLFGWLILNLVQSELIIIVQDKLLFEIRSCVHIVYAFLWSYIDDIFRIAFFGVWLRGLKIIIGNFWDLVISWVILKFLIEDLKGLSCSEWSGVQESFLLSSNFDGRLLLFRFRWCAKSMWMLTSTSDIQVFLLALIRRFWEVRK